MMLGMPRRRSCTATPAPRVRCNAAAPRHRTTRTATHGRASVVSGRGCAPPAPRRWSAAVAPGSGSGGSGRQRRRGCGFGAAAGRGSCSVPRRPASPAPTARGPAVVGCGSAAGPARSAAVMTSAIASAASSPCRFLEQSEHERSEGEHKTTREAWLVGTDVCAARGTWPARCAASRPPCGCVPSTTTWRGGWSGRGGCCCRRHRRRSKRSQSCSSRSASGRCGAARSGGSSASRWAAGPRDHHGGASSPGSPDRSMPPHRPSCAAVLATSSGAARPGPPPSARAG